MSARRPLAGPCVLICLPALLLAGAGAYFLLEEAPKLVSARRGDNTLRYKAVAAELLEGSRPDEWVGAREKGWRQASKVALSGGEPVPWGHVRRGERELVWVGSDRERLRGAYVEPMEETALWAWLYLGIPLALAVVVGMSAAGVALLVRYARERDDFVAATIHDLTTPLVALRGVLGPDDEDPRLLAERMLRMVANLRDGLFAGSRRRRPPALAPVDLVRAYGEAYALLRPEFRDRFDGADVPADGPASLAARGDATAVMQILWNLLGNALKYAAPHGPVRVRFADLGDRAAVEVADWGPGLTRRQMRRVFDRYYRADPALRSGKGGFGIGLFAARESARTMGGDLTVRANAPRGCVFALVLPKGGGDGSGG